MTHKATIPALYASSIDTKCLTKITRMRKNSIDIRKWLFLTALIAFLYSCDTTDYEELQAEHDLAMERFKTEYGITENDHIGDGIYVKTLSDLTDADTVFAEGSDHVVVGLVGFDSDNNVFDVTDHEVATSYGVERSDYIYGPIRLKIDNTFPGFYKAIQVLPEGAEAVMLFPHDQAFGEYKPILYEVSLYRVISDLAAYTDQEFQAYRELLGMDLSDTLPGFDSVYIKPLVTVDDTAHEIFYGDVVTIRLTARYVETDTAYVESFPGREFFPINLSGDSIEFEYGVLAFPITNLTHIAVENMNLGETWEILAPAQYAYGESGFNHPVMGTIIVPPDMPVHYTLKLVSYR